ncbi:apolipo protein O-domain-containing protein [Kockovaella imperatae]|uniref:MICOS complex subunit n=1 Tax=Kockovaella imperatae TaxID=4999 RepID=A0A1Y1UE40_9TREE|nr:apolipo protein O-domain-containing protein [Kockovaella imperatae]ORX35784.1 apolipo protein O-domain-containing protein [Kockovaella imperatae]
MASASHLFKPVLGGAAVFAAYTTLRQPLRAQDRSVSDSTVRPGRSSSGDKLPIYAESSDRIVTLIEVGNPISPYVAQARTSLGDAFSGASDYVQNGVSRWITFERKVEREVKSVLPKDESLTPGIIYVLIAGLTGSVLTRTRAFPIRFLAPPLLTLAAMPYFLPRTSHNLRAYLSDVEDKHFPEIGASHDQLNARLAMHWDMLTNRLGSATQDAKGWGERAVQGIENSTGLRVGDAVQRGREKVAAEREKLKTMVPVTADGAASFETVGYVVEARPVAEIVRPVEDPKPEKRMV